MLNRTQRAIAAALIVASLAACSTAAIVGSTAATISESVLPAGDLTLIKDACALASPMLSKATSSSAPSSVAGIAAYPESYCQQLALAPVGQVPATTTSTTLSWLQTAISLAQVAAQAAALL